MAKVVGYYTDRRGRVRPITARRTIFHPAKHGYLADIIRIDTPGNARRSVEQLDEEWNKADTRAKKLRLARAALEASNRARIISRNPRVSQVQREEARRVAEIYRQWADQRFRELV
jgi:hypothetical protein